MKLLLIQVFVNVPGQQPVTFACPSVYQNSVPWENLLPDCFSLHWITAIQYVPVLLMFFETPQGFTAVCCCIMQQFSVSSMYSLTTAPMCLLTMQAVLFVQPCTVILLMCSAVHFVFGKKNNMKGSKKRSHRCEVQFYITPQSCLKLQFSPQHVKYYCNIKADYSL